MNKETKYPPIVTWYLTKFPRRIYTFIMGGLVGAGLFLTAFHVSAAIPTYTVVAMFLFVGPIHIIVWYKKRRIDNE